MSGSPFDQALQRAEHALLRIERSASATGAAGARDQALRDKVAAVVGELDSIIRQAGPRR